MLAGKYSPSTSGGISDQPSELTSICADDQCSLPGRKTVPVTGKRVLRAPYTRDLKGLRAPGLSINPANDAPKGMSTDSIHRSRPESDLGRPSAMIIGNNTLACPVLLVRETVSPYSTKHRNPCVPACVPKERKMKLARPKTRLLAEQKVVRSRNRANRLRPARFRSVSVERLLRPRP